MGLTDEQKNLAMVIAAKISGSLSIVGSSFIIRDVVKRWRKKRRSNTHFPTTTWLVLSMSIADLGASFFMHVLGSWMIPEETGFPLASGNEATCTAQAFFFGLFFGASNTTNGMLALAYWLTICKDKAESDFRLLKWRALLFGMPWSYGLIYAIATSFWVIDPSDIPVLWFCFGTVGELGSKAFIITGIFVIVTFGIVLVMISYSMFALVQFVYKTQRGSSRHAALPSARSLGGNSDEKTLQVTKQGITYTCAWIAIVIPLYLHIIGLCFLSGASYSSVPYTNGFWVFVACIVPLQGLFNALVYFRPKYDTIRKRHGLSSVQALAKVLDVYIPSIGKFSISYGRSPKNSTTVVTSARNEANEDTFDDSGN